LESIKSTLFVQNTRVGGGGIPFGKRGGGVASDALEAAYDKLR
jgi:hypothetical protein